MRIPKKVKRYCKHCKKHTSHKVTIMSAGRQRGSLKHGSLIRAKKRGQGRGMGNSGRWGSKPAINKWKRRAKSTQRKVLIYKCEICGKSIQKFQGIRTAKMSIEDKLTKQQKQDKEMESKDR
jgi:large subunit ribosomal protein L44e